MLALHWLSDLRTDTDRISCRLWGVTEPTESDSRENIYRFIKNIVYE